MDQLMNFIIRPPRANYNPRNDLLDKEFMLRGRWYQRKDIEIKNCRGEILQCSHYMPLGNSDAMPLPCVIYCHGNSGCRADASEAAIVLLPSNITVFALDFSGSGLSGGEYVTLGWNEKDDLRAIVEYLRQDGNVSLIGLWGRSMGAVTSLMYGAEDPSIAGIVLDSPFSNLEELMLELVGIYAARFPKFTVKFAIQILRRAIQKKAKFDIMELNTIKAAKTCFSPVLFGHATDDDFIKPHHSDRIYDVYMGDKNIIKFEGDHNSARPPFYFDSINIFFHNVLQPPLVEWGETYTDTMHCFFTKASGANLQGAANPDSSDASKVAEPSSSPSDVGELVQPKRPMSRMEIPPDISLEENEPKAKAVSNDIIDKEAEHDQLSSSKEKGFEQQPSSHPCTPHDPTMKHDDAYSAFKLNNFTGFPCSAEEEERMVMEAVIMSLKDLKMQNSYVVPEEASVSSSANIEPDPDASSVTGH